MSLVSPSDLKLRVRSDLFEYDSETPMSDERLQLHLDRAISMLVTAVTSQGGPPLTDPLPEDMIGGICGAATYFALVDRGYTPAQPKDVYRMQFDDWRKACEEISQGILHPFGVPSQSTPEVGSSETSCYIGIGGGIGRTVNGAKNRGY